MRSMTDAKQNRTQTRACGSINPHEKTECTTLVNHQTLNLCVSGKVEVANSFRLTPVQP